MFSSLIVLFLFGLFAGSWKHYRESEYSLFLVLSAGCFFWGFFFFFFGWVWSCVLSCPVFCRVLFLVWSSPPPPPLSVSLSPRPFSLCVISRLSSCLVSLGFVFWVLVRSRLDFRPVRFRLVCFVLYLLVSLVLCLSFELLYPVCLVVYLLV